MDIYRKQIAHVLITLTRLRKFDETTHQTAIKVNWCVKASPEVILTAVQSNICGTMKQFTLLAAVLCILGAQVGHGFEDVVRNESSNVTNLYIGGTGPYSSHH